MAIDLNDPNKKKGAIDALRAIIASKQRKLVQEPDDDGDPNGPKLTAPKNTEVKSYSDDGTPDDSEQNHAELQKLNEPDQIEQELADIHTDTEIRRSQAQAARKKEIDRLTRNIKGDLRNFSSFATDLFRALNTQVGLSKHPEDSYGRLNPTYAGTDYLMPGKMRVEKKNRPSLAIYFDQSGSWGSGDIKKGIDALASIRDLERRHKIKKVTLKYFANNLHTTEKGDGWYESGTSGYDQVVQDIIDNGYNNVIIMSDDDIEAQTSWNLVPTLEIKGAVWFIWRGGSRSRTAVKRLTGKQGSFEYNMK